MTQTLEQEVKDDNRVVAGWLLYYHERKNDYERRREIILHSSGASAFDGQPRGTELGDTTGHKGDKLAELHERTGEWLELVEDIERRLPPKMRIILERRRECIFATRKKYKGRPPWIPYVQVKYAEDMAMMEDKKLEDVWVNTPDIFTDWWKQIVMYATVLAGKKNLL